MKQLKEYYNSINDTILKDNLENSLLNIYEPYNTTFSKEEIYNEYIRYYDDFNFYIDKLINKDNINNNDDFKSIIEYLMVNISHTNQFINRYLILKGNKEFLKQKIKYMSKEQPVEKLLLENINIIYKLNPDNIPLLLSNYWIPLLFTLLLIIVIIMSFAYPHKFVWWIAVILYVLCYINMLPKFNYIDNQNSFYFSKYKYVAHPFTNKFKFSDIITTLKMFTDIIKKQ